MGEMEVLTGIQMDMNAESKMNDSLRQTGRTTRQLQKALGAQEDGFNVIYILAYHTEVCIWSKTPIGATFLDAGGHFYTPQTWKGFTWPPDEFRGAVYPKTMFVIDHFAEEEYRRINNYPFSFSDHLIF